MTRRALAVLALVVIGLSAGLSAQLNMPDPKQISGVPLPDSSMPSGSISVRVIRGSLANNLAGVDVMFLVNGRARTAMTDASGHAQVAGLARGSRVTVSATVAGERLESREVVVGDGGTRFVLAATDPDVTARAAEDRRLAAGPAARGTIVFGGASRIVAEFISDRLNIYYMLEAVNTARTPVDLGGPLVIDLPPGAAGAATMEDSSPQTTVKGERVTVTGPFAPGVTKINIGFGLPYGASGAARLEQRWPVSLQEVSILALKTGDVDLRSPQAPSKRIVDNQGQAVIVASGGGLSAGQVLQFDLTGLPHHALWPRYTALAMAGTIMCVGIWAAVFPGSRRRAA